MEESTLWTVGSLLGCALLGAAGGALVLAQGSLTEAQFAAAMFVAMFVGPAMGLQLYRRGLGKATATAGACGALAVLAFFAIPVGASFGPDTDLGAISLFLVVAPMVAGAVSAGGALFLARGVDRYRSEHGLKHAPK